MSGLKEILINLVANFTYPVKKWISPIPAIRSVYETIDLLKQGKSIARFGDGEFHILNQTESLGFQKMDKQMSVRLKEVLISDNESCLIGLPSSLTDVNNLKSDASLFWRRFFVFHYSKIIPYLRFDKWYYDSNVSRPYMDYIDNRQAVKVFNEMKVIWGGKKVLVIEGQFSKLGVGNDLFNNVLELKRVLTLSKNAFSLYDEILEYLKTIIGGFDLILIALGPTATIMAYDLSLMGIQAIDIGHIDVEYEWFLNKVEHKVSICGKYVNEVPLNDGLEQLEENVIYSSQIIKEIYGHV